MRKCILLDISRSGAQIALERPMQVGEAGFLTFAELEVFGCVVRKGEGVNGLEFDVALSDADVLGVRHFAEVFDADERQSLKREARAWVMGRG
ncbi:MAG: PilZ domain-containing protein [Erythrobacter sp.]